jgi:hypothetical protein
MRNQQLQREINPKVFAAAEWKSKLKAKNPFVLDVLANAKIFRVGDVPGSVLISAGERYKPSPMWWVKTRVSYLAHR